MKKITFASVRRGAGKTSIIVGFMKSLDKKSGYIKPFGDRLVYRKKHLHDYDVSLMTDLFNSGGNAEEINIGLGHSKLRYMHDDKSVEKNLVELVKKSGAGKDVLFIEGGADLSYGASVRLDSLSINDNVDGELIIIVSGNDDSVLDDIAFIKRHLNIGNKNFAGVIINKVKDADEFKSDYLDAIKMMGVKLLGIIPYAKDLTRFMVGYLADMLPAKIIAGEDGRDNIVDNIFVGAMSSNAAMKKPLFKQENKLIITSGDRSDMILAAINTDSSGIVLTNDILPPSNIISQASERNIPLLSVHMDTYQVAKQIDDMEPLIAAGETAKLDILAKLVADNVSILL